MCEVLFGGETRKRDTQQFPNTRSRKLSTQCSQQAWYEDVDAGGERGLYSGVVWGWLPAEESECYSDSDKEEKNGYVPLWRIKFHHESINVGLVLNP
jgi:hypothetical protein